MWIRFPHNAWCMTNAKQNKVHNKWFQQQTFKVNKLTITTLLRIVRGDCQIASFTSWRIMLQFAQFGPIHFIGMFWIQPKWQLAIGRRGRKSGHHGHKDFSTNPKPYKTQIFNCLFIFLTTYWKYILLIFWVTSFSLFGPTNEGGMLALEWLVFNGKLMGG
jgi:hypothetical protein